jgi:hypothetical protein
MGVEYAIVGDVKLEYVLNANIMVKSGFIPLDTGVTFEPFVISNTNFFEFVAQIMNLRKLKVDTNYGLVYYLHDDTMKNHLEIRKMKDDGGGDYTIKSLVLENVFMSSTGEYVETEIIKTDTDSVVNLIDSFCSQIDTNVYKNDVQDIMNKQNKYHMMRLKWVLMDNTDEEEVRCETVSNTNPQSGGGAVVTHKQVAGRKKQNNEIHVTMYLHKMMKMIFYRYLIHTEYNIGLREFLGELCVNIIIFLLLNDDDFIYQFVFDQFLTSIALMAYRYMVQEGKIEGDINHVSGIILVPYYVAFL